MVRDVMTKYAMIIYADEGSYWYVPLLTKGTLDEAVKAALEEIHSTDHFNDDGDMSFKIIEVASVNEFTTANHQAFFAEKKSAEQKRYQEQEDRNEKAYFERLKKKFETNK